MKNKAKTSLISLMIAGTILSSASCTNNETSKKNEQYAENLRDIAIEVSIDSKKTINSIYKWEYGIVDGKYTISVISHYHKDVSESPGNTVRYDDHIDYKVTYEINEEEYRSFLKLKGAERIPFVLEMVEKYEPVQVEKELSESMDYYKWSDRHHDIIYEN